MNPPLLTPASCGWLGIATALAAGTLLLAGADPTAFDWQPALALAQPWRALTAMGVHYSALHLGANLAGAALVAALGVAAKIPVASAWAWVAALPLTQIGLLARPDLQHYGGLSGVLHAGVAVAALHLVVDGSHRHRVIGMALLGGLIVKVLGEAPWGPALRHPAGWDIATAPVAHASGLVAGLVCVALAAAQRRRARSAAKRREDATTIGR